jgi:hypothetical protein
MASTRFMVQNIHLSNYSVRPEYSNVRERYWQKDEENCTKLNIIMYILIRYHLDNGQNM